MSKTLDQWLSYIESCHSKGIELGLDRLQTVSERLGQRKQCPIITVAGTNGKGSTCAMLVSILSAAGYRVGSYNSPHLVNYTERVRINGVPVSEAALCEAFARVEAAREAVPLTYFEFGTLAAWEVFAREGVDALVLEVGMGGRLDAVNLYEPDCAIVTTIDLDHMDFLGHTREAIGREKAGVFRAGKPAVCGDPHPPESLLQYATDIGAGLRVLGRDFGYQRQDHQWSFWGTAQRRNSLAYPGLRGGNQLQNASVVLEALDSVRTLLPVAMQDIRRGLLEVELAGRFQVLPGQPTIVLDVAHNPQSAAVLADNLGSMSFHPDTWLVLGMLGDKDIPTVIRLLAKRATRWMICALEGPRAAAPEILVQAIADAGVTDPVEIFPNPASALKAAQERANEGDRIVVTGSFLTVSEALTALGRTA